MRKLLNGLFYFIFWFWNAAFLSVAYMGILPFTIILLAEVFLGRVPLDFLLTLVTLVVVPLGCAIVAAEGFANKPGQLMRLFYGVEAPLFLLCLIRLFFIREVTAASSQVLGTLGLCILAFGGEFLFGYLGRREGLSSSYQKALAGLQLVCHTLMLLIGLWVGALLLFYAIPLGTWLVVGFFRFNWLGVLWNAFIYSPQSAIMGVFLFLGLFVLSCGLFVAMPPVLTALYVQSWRRISRTFAAQFGWGKTALTAGSTLAIWLFMFGALQQQPQVPALDFLSSSTPDTRQILTRLKHSETIRQGLVNAYLMPYRYLSTWQESNNIQVMYQAMFGLPDTVTGSLQQVYNGLMSPFLYQGDRAESEQAAQLYAEFFDAPIQRNERSAIERALQSTYNRQEAKAGVLNVNQQKVWLAKQELTVVEQGDWAEVELHEAYENQTPDLQEIFYYFSLPESAAVTGLWLGDTDDKTKRFVYTVSPRGAAQQVYNNQVQERVDPALLEQVGPRQYRLRAFPIPVNSPLFDEKLQGYKPKQMHLWLTYKVMAQPGVWALPQLTEKRNIYWTTATDRTYQGKKLTSSWWQPLPNVWLPPALKMTRQSQPQQHSVDFASGYQTHVEPIAPSAYILPKGQRFAVVLDTSRSMAAHLAPMTEALTWLKANVLKANSADVYLTAASSLKPTQLGDLRNIDVSNLTALNFYGKLQLKEVLQQYSQLKGQLKTNKSYDAVLVITDEGSYELSDDEAKLPAMIAPVLMVHLGNTLPPGYDDETLKVIQDSGGAVSTQIADLLQRSATQAKLAQANPATSINVIDGYTWRSNPTLAKTASTKEGFQALAARQLITGLSKTVKLDRPEQLDAIHQIAKQSSIVTPYSSMIVLVNDQQREELKKAEQQKDRFDREVETGNEELTKPSNPLSTDVSGVPEPEEWLLLSVGGVILLWLIKRQRNLASE